MPIHAVVIELRPAYSGLPSLSVILLKFVAPKDPGWVFICWLASNLGSFSKFVDKYNDDLLLVLWSFSMLLLLRLTVTGFS